MASRHGSQTFYPSTLSQLLHGISNTPYNKDIIETASSNTELVEGLTSRSPALSYEEDTNSSSSQQNNMYNDDVTEKTRNLSSKSFTIAAILGLKGQVNSGSDHGVMNLSVQDRLSDREFEDGPYGSAYHNYYAGRHDIHGQRQANVGGRNSPVHSNVLGTETEERCRLKQPIHSQTGLHQKTNKQSHAIQSTNSGSMGGRSKRIRTIFTPEQLERLEAEFERQQYMVGPERLYLAHALQLTEAQVKVWFQNRRIKWRKHHLEITQQRLAIIQRNQHIIDNNRAHSDSSELSDEA